MLLGFHQVEASESANCANNDFGFVNVLTASSRTERLMPRPSFTNDFSVSFSIDNLQDANNNALVEESDLHELNIDETHPLVVETRFAIKLEDHIASYIASVLEKCIIEGRWYSPLRCNECLRVFSEDEPVDDEFVKLKMKTSKLRAPARSTVEICKQTELSMREFDYGAGQFNEIQIDVLNALNFNSLFWISDFDSHAEPNHKMRLVQLIIEMYIRKKQEYISKCNTLAAHDVLWRTFLNKLVHYRGQ